MESKQTDNADFVIIGAGILGLSIALKLCEAYPTAKISVIEKETSVGQHASGRNSGVLHSGIYYPPQSLKAKLCSQGAQLMREYCIEHRLPLNQIGKVIVPTQPDDMAVLNVLYQRGLANGIQVEQINSQQLHELEPATQSIIGSALFVPETAVVDSKAIMQHLYQHLRGKGVRFHLGQACQRIQSEQRLVILEKYNLSYGYLINTAGLYADKIAEMCGLTNKYTMLPFKGLYYELSPGSTIKLNRLIYPVPDMNVPFLGVHFTKSVYGKIYVGPTAVPAFGREHYRGMKGMKFREASHVLYQLLLQYKLNHQGFRTYAHNEVGRFLKSKFVNAAKVLVPNVNPNDLKLSAKVGIRAQLLDLQKRTLVMDFLTEKTRHEIHILNAVSPAFTSAFSFSQYVVDQIH